MASRKLKAEPTARRVKGVMDGQRTYSSEGRRILTHSVGALPIINRVLERMRLEEIVAEHVGKEHKRTKIDTARVAMLMVRNMLISREPVYGMIEWARDQGPEYFDIDPDELDGINDDRCGRCLERMFELLDTNLIMDVVTHVVTEFGLSLEELHNDSTTVTFHGEYAESGFEQLFRGQVVPAITWGHNKDHRPDLKQLLYILTVTEDGGVPLYFEAASGNVVDDATHQRTWRLMRELVGRPDFVYVADCKLATTANLNELARLGGRFITVLPASRKEDSEFRGELRKDPGSITWDHAYELKDEDGNILDLFRVARDEAISKEGYRLLWFHSLGKAHTDSETRARRLQRAIRELEQLRNRLAGPRTRLRDAKKVRETADAILEKFQVGSFLQVATQKVEEVTHRQQGRGRPNKETKYVREVKARVTLHWELQAGELEQAAGTDGVFPLISNIRDWEAADILRAYKRQPIIEKRFSQLKTDYRLAPVYLKNTRRIVGLLAIYFFALMVQSLLERELRNAMEKRNIESLPLYPEGRPCTSPTTRQVIDTFAPLARHSIVEGDDIEVLCTELAPIHRRILSLLKISKKDFYR